MQWWWQSQNLSMDHVIWPSLRATFMVCSIVCMYLLEFFMQNFGRIFYIFGSFVPYSKGQMFHAWKFHTKVLYSSTIKTASFWTPWSCGGHQVTTKDASCNNLSIAKEQLKGKLTVVPIKNPNDHEMLKVFREYFFLLDQLVVKYYSITRVWPLIWWNEIREQWDLACLVIAWGRMTL